MAGMKKPNDHAEPTKVETLKKKEKKEAHSLTTASQMTLGQKQHNTDLKNYVMSRTDLIY